MIPLKAIFAVIGGVLIHLTLGTLYCWGNMNPYVASYIRRHSSPSTLRYNDTIWVFALTVTGQGLAMFVGGLLEKKIGTRLAVLSGCFLTSLGVFLSAFSIKYSYYLFLVTYGLMFGVGVGIAYAIPMAVAMNWFPNYKGVANGFIVAGFGGGAFIFDQLQTAYLNPDNIKAVGQDMLNTTQHVGKDKYFIDETVLDRVPKMFYLLAGIYTAMQCVGVLCLFQAPATYGLMGREENESLIRDDDNSSDNRSINKHITYTATMDYTTKEMIKSRPFITMWFMYVMNALVVIFISSLYKTYGEGEVVNDDKFLALVGALAAVCNSFGRILWGLFADKFSFKVAICTMCAMMTCLMGSLYITHIFAEQAGRPLLMIWICLIFLTFSGNFALFPTATAKTFGSENAALNYGILFTSSAVSGLLGAVLSSVLLEKIKSLGLFILCAALSLISLTLGLTFNVRRNDGKAI